LAGNVKERLWRITIQLKVQLVLLKKGSNF
jgi:hypothetical protein